MGIRTFVVRVSESEPRVVIEDVRSRVRVVATDLASVAGAIARLLDQDRSPDGPPPRGPLKPPH